jgi:hypothetical protein
MTRRIAAEEERVYKRLMKEAEAQMTRLQDAEIDQDRRKQAQAVDTAQAKIREDRENQEHLEATQQAKGLRRPSNTMVQAAHEHKLCKDSLSLGLVKSEAETAGMDMRRRMSAAYGGLEVRVASLCSIFVSLP